MSYGANRNEFAERIDDDHHRWHGLIAVLTGVLRATANAIFKSRPRQADRGVAQFIERSGGRLTDDIERQMTQHLTSSNFSLSRQGRRVL